MVPDNHRKYVGWGVTAFAVIAVSVVFYFVIERWSGFTGAIGSLLAILAPFSWGLVVAFILDSLVTSISALLTKIHRPGRAMGPRGQKVCRGLSIALSEIILIAIVTVLIRLIVPQVIDSLRTLVSNFDYYGDNLDRWVMSKISHYPTILPYYESFKENISGVEDMVGNFIKNDLLRVATTSLAGVGTSIYNVIIGMIVSVYMLISKRHLLGLSKKLLFTVAPVRWANVILREMRRTIRVFKGYLVGKLLDSLIIGVLCYLGTTILGIPYALLISIIVGVTNIIPSFGPVIGAVPSAFLVLMVDPTKCLIFVIFVIVLQQFDGNLIGPKILGNSTGVSALGVLFAIVMGGGFMGVVGMIISVPTYAVAYSLLKRLSEKRLAAGHMPTETRDYITLDAMNPDTLTVTAMTGKKAASGRKKRGK